MKKTVTVHAAKTNLSRLIQQALAGEEIIITRGATPVVRLVPLQLPTTERKPGALKGELHLGPGFFEPLPSDELQAWGDK